MLFQAVDEGHGVSLAIACDGKELSVWDILSASCKYQAKGQKPNKLGLTDRPRNTAVAFIPGSSGRQVLVGTMTGKLALYDLSQRRPRFTVAFRESKITALASEASGEQP